MAISLLLVALVLIIIGLILPRHMQVQRDIVIAAAPIDIFSHVNDLRAFNEWSPWRTLDPNTKYRFSGPTQGVGATMHWQSDEPSVGSGSQTISEAVAHERVVTQLDFGNQGGGVATFIIQPEAGGSRLSWSFASDFGFNLIGRYLAFFIKPQLAKEYEKGLNTLKQRIEQPN